MFHVLYIDLSGEPAVYDWDRIVLKPVRSKDNQDVGNVISTEKDTITIHSGRYEFIVSKNDVEGFNGGEVFLTKNYVDLQKSKMKPWFFILENHNCRFREIYFIKCFPKYVFILFDLKYSLRGDLYNYFQKYLILEGSNSKKR